MIWSRADAADQAKIKTRRSKAGLASFAFVIAASPLLVLVTLFDAVCLFEALPYLRTFFLGVLSVFILLFLPLMWAHPAGWLSSVGVLLWMAILPQVRWNSTKAFYADARLINQGMTALEVRMIMDAYVELGADGVEDDFLRELAEWYPRNKLVFLPSESAYPDSCEVDLHEGRVKAVATHKD